MNTEKKKAGKSDATSTNLTEQQREVLRKLIVHVGCIIINESPSGRVRRKMIAGCYKTIDIRVFTFLTDAGYLELYARDECPAGTETIYSVSSRGIRAVLEERLARFRPRV